MSENVPSRYSTSIALLTATMSPHSPVGLLAEDVEIVNPTTGATA